MATQREILKRINSVKSTKKITKTMEMISAAKMKKMQGRLANSKPYINKIESIISYIKGTQKDIAQEKLLQEKAEPNKVLLILFVGNRGLCGGYNTNVIENTLSFKNKLIEEGKDVSLYVIGKKGRSYFSFINVPIYKGEDNPEDKISYKDAETLGDDLINYFDTEEFDEVYISYTAAITTSSFKPEIFRLLPIDAKDIREDAESDESEEENPIEYLYHPDPQRIVSVLLPLFIKMKIYTSLLESGFAEQFARRVAMKNATDAATDMVKDLTIKYNRARQAKITGEIAEIVGGAAALE